MYKTFFNIIKFRRMKKSATKEDLFTANKSPLNTSKSKAMFKFTQGERFPNLTSKDTYSSYHTAITSMKKHLCLINDHHLLVMEIRQISHCKWILI